MIPPPRGIFLVHMQLWLIKVSTQAFSMYVLVFQYILSVLWTGILYPPFPFGLFPYNTWSVFSYREPIKMLTKLEIRLADLLPDMINLFPSQGIASYKKYHILLESDNRI